MKNRKCMILILLVLVLLATSILASATAPKLQAPPTLPNVQVPPTLPNVQIPPKIGVPPVIPKLPMPTLRVNPLPDLPTPTPKPDTGGLLDLADVINPEMFSTLKTKGLTKNPALDIIDWARLAELLDLDEEEFDPNTLPWQRFGRMNNPGGSVTVYSKPSGGGAVGSYEHGYPIWNFALLDSHPGWVIWASVKNYDGSLAMNHACFFPSEYLIVPVNEFAEDVEAIADWEEGAYTLPGDEKVPAYDGPGTHYNIIGYFNPSEHIWSSAPWPKDPNWIVVFDKRLVGTGYGDGQGFIEAKYYVK